jgi:hypothetical protein
MNVKQALTKKGLAALLLGATVLASSCKKNDSDLTTPSGMSDSTLTSVKSEGIMATSTSNNSLIFNNPFEAPDCLSDIYLERATANSLTRSSDQARTGTYSAKFILNKTDAIVGGSKRTEAVLEWVTPPKYERWYGMSMFLPNSYIADPAEEQLFQWHSQASVDLDGVSSLNSPMAMYTRNGRWEFGMKFGGKIDLGAYEKNAWTDWVVHVKWSHESDGLVEIWKNGKLVVQKNGRNNYHDLKGHFFKIGIYKYGWLQGYESNTTSRTIYYDDVKIGNENASYAAVAPQSNGTTPAPTAPAPEPTAPAPAPTTPTLPTNSVVFAVNAGGSAYKAANGITYQADKNYSGGRTFKTATTNYISRTSDDAMYQSERYGNFGYNIPLANGTYEVTYKFAEIYHSRSGKRRFDVLAEGSETVSNLDLYYQTGRFDAYDVVKLVTVKDGVLNIQFRTDIDNAKLSALHVIKK